MRPRAPTADGPAPRGGREYKQFLRAVGGAGDADWYQAKAEHESESDVPAGPARKAEAKPDAATTLLSRSLPTTYDDLFQLHRKPRSILHARRRESVRIGSCEKRSQDPLDGYARYSYSRICG